MNFLKQFISKKTLTFSFFLLLSAEFIYNVSAYVINSVLGKHILSVEDYGRYSLVIGFNTMLITLIAGRGGIPTAMAKKISENRDKFALIRGIKKTAMKMQTLVVISLTLTLYFLSSFFATKIFQDPTLAPIFKLSALIVPTFAVSSFHTLYFNGMKRFGAMTAMKASRGFFRIFWILGLGYFLHLNGAIWGNILAPLFVFFVALFIEIFIFKDYSQEKIEASISGLNEHEKKLAENYPWKKLFSYAGAFMLFSVFYEFFNRLDIYSIKVLLGDDFSTGIYNASLNIALIPYNLVTALTFILFPVVSNLKSEKNHEKIQKLVKKMILFLFVTLIPTEILMIIFSDFIIKIMYGQKYMQSGPLIFLLAGVTIFSTIFFVLSAIWNGAGEIKVTTILTILATILGLSLNYFFTPIYGIKATAIISSITSAFMGLSLLILTYFKFLRTEKCSNATRS